MAEQNAEQLRGDSELAKRGISAACGQLALLAIYASWTRFASAFRWQFIALVSVICIFNFFRLYLCFRQMDYYPNRRLLWVRLFALSVLLPGAAWGAMIIMAVGWFGLSNYTALVSLLMGSGIAAAVTVSTGPNRNIGRIFIAEVIGLPAIEFLWMGNHESLGLSAILSAYFGFLWYQLDIHHRTFWDGVGFQAELVETHERAETGSRLATLGEVAANIAHEIRNPLSVMMTSTEILQRCIERGGCEWGDLRSSMARCLAAGRRIDKIVTSMTRFSRGSEFEPYATTQLSVVVRESVDLILPRFSEKHVALRISPIDESLSIRCRPVEISQVLINLLHNSLDAVQSQKEKWVHLGVTSTSESVLISIVDSGKGIPEKIRERLFDPFFTTKPRGFGTGIGLSLSKRLVEEHRGVIKLDTSARNTTFLLEFPRADPERLEKAA